jgi:hypothetical protein
MFSCQNKNDAYDKFKIIDSGTWNLLAIKSSEGYIIGSSDYQIISGSYLVADFKYKKILIKIKDKEVQGDFIIKKEGEDYTFSIYNASDTLFNDKYEIVLNTLSEDSLSTDFGLILKSENLFIATKKIEVGKSIIDGLQ